MSTVQVVVPWLVVAAVYFGLLLASGIVATVVYDLIALRRGWRTVSLEAAILSRSQPVFAVLLTGLLCFALGVLIGHLFFPQYVLVVGPEHGRFPD